MIVLIILHVFVSIVLIAVILLQAGKGGGLSGAFGGASQELFGTKSSAFLNRATSVCAILFLITCLSLGVISSRQRVSLMESVSLTEAPPVGPSEAGALPIPEDLNTLGETIPTVDETSPEKGAETKTP